MRVESMVQIRDCSFELLRHPAYSPDLALSDFHLFPNIKKHLGGHKFPSNEDVQNRSEPVIWRLLRIFFFNWYRIFAKQMEEIN